MAGQSDRPNALQIIGSVLSAMIGVSKEERRKRDFSQGRPVDFIIAGVVLTTLFILAVVGVVKLVLTFAMGGS